MNFLKSFLITCILLLSVLFIRPAWADAGRYINTPEYIQVTQAIANLTDPDKTTDFTPEVQFQLAELRFQKYILETASSRSVCRNETGKTLGIYTKSKKTPLPVLSFLGSGQETDDDIECVGIFLPAGSKVAPSSLLTSDNEGFADPAIVKFVPGSQLIVTADSETGILDFNVPNSGFFKSGEIDWNIPTLTQAEVESQTPNAPVD